METTNVVTNANSYSIRRISYECVNWCNYFLYIWCVSVSYAWSDSKGTSDHKACFMQNWGRLSMVEQYLSQSNERRRCICSCRTGPAHQILSQIDALDIVEFTLHMTCINSHCHVHFKPQRIYIGLILDIELFWFVILFQVDWSMVQYHFPLHWLNDFNIWVRVWSFSKHGHLTFHLSERLQTKMISQG